MDAAGAAVSEASAGMWNEKQNHWVPIIAILAGIILVLKIMAVSQS